jgi:hypothetical protein
MIYVHRTDIKRTPGINVRDLDRALARVIGDIEFAVTKQGHLSAESKQLIPNLLSQFLTTHESILALIRKVKRNPLLATDAVSLCREQVEKLYILALIVERPSKWIRQYLRNNWQSMYERHLTVRDEYREMERFKDFIELQRRTLDRMKRWPNKDSKRGYVLLVSDRAEKAARFGHYNRNAPAGQWPQYFGKGTKNKYIAYFSFPTPGKALKKIGKQLLKSWLERWYEEYKYFSAFTHGQLDKLMLEFLVRNKSAAASDKLAQIRLRLVEETVHASYAAATTACTIVATALETDYGSKKELREFWELLSRTALFARAMWDGWGKKILL